MQDWISSTKPIVFSSSRKYVKLFFHFHLNEFIVNSLPSMSLEPLNNIHCKNYIKLWIDATCFINNIMDLLLVLFVVCLLVWLNWNVITSCSSVTFKLFCYFSSFKHFFQNFGVVLERRCHSKVELESRKLPHVRECVWECVRTYGRICLIC